MVMLVTRCALQCKRYAATVTTLAERFSLAAVAVGRALIKTRRCRLELPELPRYRGIKM